MTPCGKCRPEVDRQIEEALLEYLELDLGFYWDWVGQPVADEDGITPEKSDYRITVGVGYDF